MKTDLSITKGGIGHRKKTAKGWEDESLWEHLRLVGVYMEGFSKQLPLPKTLKCLAFWHDLGKNCEAFIRRLGGGDSFDHTAAGAKHAQEVFPSANWCLRDLISYCIAGHHRGLPNGRTAGENDIRETLWDSFRKEEGAADGIPLWRKDVPAGVLVPVDGLDAWQGKGDSFSGCGTKQQKIWGLQVLGRMLFSCLVDADFMATEDFMNPKGRELLREQQKTQSELFDNLSAYLHGIESEAKDTPMNRGRAQLREIVWNLSDGDRGWKTLNVPTGGGKTFLTAGYALLHNQKHGGSRVIYAVPYTSIIEENAETLKNAMGASEADFAEHHSNIAEEKDTPENRVLSENWEAPFVVTTHVQLFDSLFANRPGKCRKLHNLIGSTIILDEAQKIPPMLLKPILATLKILVESYRVTVIVCTATQPLLDAEHCDDSGIKEWEDLVPDAQTILFGASELRVPRTREVYLGAISQEQLVDLLAAEKQALCIVNSRRKCKEVFDKLRAKAVPGSNVRHLSTWQTPMDRRRVIDEVRRFLADGENIILVSTSLIEAGVNLDFPVLARETAGCDSIAQACGRCNREGLLPHQGRVMIFELPGKVPPELGMAAQFAREAGNSERWIDSETMHAYFKLAIWGEGERHGLDACGLLGELAPRIDANGKPNLVVNFRTIAKKAKCIDSADVSVVVISSAAWEDIEAEFRKKRYLSRETKRMLRQHSVGVSPWVSKKWISEGKIIEDGKSGILRLTDPNNDYLAESGLQVLNQDLPILTY